MTADGFGSETVQFARARLAGLAMLAEQRGLAPNSLAGISLLLAACAATWFSAGTTSDALLGVLAVVGWLLARNSARGLAARAGDRAFAWPFAVATVAGECIVYAGIAAGGAAAGWPGMWSLGTATVIAVAIAGMLVACGPGMPARSSRWYRRVLAPSTGARVLLAVLILVLRGPRLALFSVLAVEVVFAFLAVARRGRAGRHRAAPGHLVRACRDDGEVVGWAGRLVQGNIPPLPTAIAGTAGAVLLAALGLRGALGFISLAPVVVLMLAAPGSGHPHNGRFDWLVPSIMALGQLVYLAALGFAWTVPGPVVFAICGLTAVWSAGLAAGGPAGTLARGSAGRDQPRRLGWEGRLFIAGLAAIFGIATLGYVGLATFLAVQIGRRALAGAEDAVDRAGARGWGQQAAPPGN
jgi:hypothetical protein